MPFFDATTKRFALRIGLPAILVLVATFAVVIFSLSKMAGEVNRIESTLTERSVAAAIHSVLRHIGETNNDYAEWDDAARNLYGDVNVDWAIDNIVTSTNDPVFFDTIYLLDEDGKAVLAYRNGEAVSATPAEAFGPSLASVIAGLPNDGKTYGVKTGMVKGAWGLAAIAAGPVVPYLDKESAPPRSRYLVIGKALDDAAVQRLGEDFNINGLRLVDPLAAGPLKIDLTDPNGTVVGAFAWSPGRLGSQAYEGISPAVLAALALVALTMAFLVVVSLRGWKEVQKRQLHLGAALANMSHGLCMFGADGKLLMANERLSEICRTPPETFKPGMTISKMMAAAFDNTGLADVDPEGTLALERQFLRESKPASMIERLTDGRSIAINYRPVPSGGFVATFEDITERLLAEEKIRHLAHHDALTDLLNRAAFYERMRDALTHLRRSESLAVLTLDLDHFKGVNDMLGHPIGDSLLQAAAERMRSCVRGEDIVARLGGDEFAIVQVPSDQPQDITALATRLIEVVGAPFTLDGEQVVVGVSVGIAIAPADGSEPDLLMKNADLALYRAKAEGGGVYRFFELEMDARMRARRAIELDLRKAILNDQFELHYQPIINIKSGKLTSCEALIRWHHPERGTIQPADFIPVAEATGIIVPLGEWVLRRACFDAMKWPKDVTVSVNLSPAQFKSKHLVAGVVGALAATGLPANRLELEITELVLLQESDDAFVILHQLRELGIRIAMDDFGTGYSSLGYLRSFPFDKIKIDQSFIRDLPDKEESLAIIRAVVGLSGSLGITTTAEGVETEAQLASLIAEGCSEYQGFLFSMPRPAAEVAGLIEASHARTAVA